ncbi:MAG: response regulator transcription factor [Nitrospirae bacterium]|nr:response regulator transcription factor [Nitrospirota bacterium]
MSPPAHKKILIVEDEHDILQLVKLYVEKEGFRTVSATSGTEGLRQVKQEKPDLVVLDLMLPGIDGLEVCKRLRAAPETALLPIIMLTAKAEEADTVVGLELGADDYITKPFSPKTLVARIKALFRRLERKPDGSLAHYRYGDLVMDLARHEVTVKKVEVPLTAKEFGLLEHLLSNPGRVLTRDILLNTVWGYDYYGTTRTVDVHIRRLKQKLPSLNEAIISVRHCLRDEAKEIQPDARPQARKNRRRIHWNTLRIFQGRERRRWLQLVRRSRTGNVGQAPRHKKCADIFQRFTMNR